MGNDLLQMSAEAAKIRGTVKTEFSVMFGLLTVVACYSGSPSCEHIILHSMLSAVGCLPK